MNKLRVAIIVFVVLIALACSAVPNGDGIPTVTPAPTTPRPTATPRPADDDDDTLPITQPGDDRDLRQQLIRSTVQIIALVQQGGQLQPVWTGSGTILTPDGLILTNAHVASDTDPDYRPDALGVAVTGRSDQTPDLRYLAEVRAIDYQLDLAVIQIVSDLDGRPIDSGSLQLSYVPPGDSNVLELGDLVQILGYPGIGGETITFTEGVVSGFTRERSVEGRAWIKTDATIAGGNSGGLAANDAGQLIGVPTQVGYGGAERFADCRYLADTNGDGVINENDNCIPVGGFINALRPVNLAKPLIESARHGIEVPTPAPPSPGEVGDARFANLLFSPDVTENDQPTQVVTQLPSGTTAIYAFWEYAGMADGAMWEARWYQDGEYLSGASWPSAPWEGGSSGSWWISVYNDSGLDDGTYRVELYVQDELLLEGSIAVGGQATGGPTFTNLTFSEGITDDDRPTNPTHMLPSGIDRVYAFFDFAAMSDGLSWRRVWSYEGEEVASGSGTWEFGSSGSAWASLSDEDALDPGSYRLQIYVEGSLVAASNFTVAGTQQEEAIGPITFASGIDAQGAPVNPGTSFDTGLSELHFFCDYAGMQNGLQFEERWLLNGEELVTFDLDWEWGERGTYHDSIYHTAGDPLPDGQYTLELYVEGNLVQSATATVGTGSPPPPPTPEDGLYIYGVIFDADTGNGIPGALYIVLNPGVSIAGWDGSEGDIYTMAESDANGNFELPRPLQRNEAYSMIVWAEGYIPLEGDDVMVGDEASPLEMEIALQRE